MRPPSSRRLAFSTSGVRFRRADLAGDAAAITASGARAVKQRGGSNFSPTERFRAAEVAPIIARMLDEVVPGGGVEADSTQRAEIEALRTAPADAVNPTGAGLPASTRLADFDFQYGANGWRLAAACFEPDK